MGNIPIQLASVVLECKDVAALSNFYSRLLGWEKNWGADDEWVSISAPSGGFEIAFQQNLNYIPPVWPDEVGKQQQMAHLDFTVPNKAQMDAAVAHAIACGATKAAVQYEPKQWTTMIDPAGHPLCFVIQG